MSSPLRKLPPPSASSSPTRRDPPAPAISSGSSPDRLHQSPLRGSQDGSDGNVYLYSFLDTPYTPRGGDKREALTSSHPNSPQVNGRAQPRTPRSLVGGTADEGNVVTPRSRSGLQPQTPSGISAAQRRVTAVPLASHDSPLGGPLGGCSWNRVPESMDASAQRSRIGTFPSAQIAISSTLDEPERGRLPTQKRLSSGALLTNRASATPTTAGARSVPTDLTSSFTKPNPPRSDLISVSSFFDYDNGSMRAEFSDVINSSTGADDVKGMRGHESPETSDEAPSYLSSASFFVELNSAMETFMGGDVLCRDGDLPTRSEASSTHTSLQLPTLGDATEPTANGSREPSEAEDSRADYDDTDMSSLMLADIPSPVAANGTATSPESPKCEPNKSAEATAATPEVEKSTTKPHSKRMRRSVSFVGVDDNSEREAPKPAPAPAMALPATLPPVMPTTTVPQAGTVGQMQPMRGPGAPMLQTMPPWMVMPQAHPSMFGAMPGASGPAFGPRRMSSISGWRS